jgi:preprotein translocase subunit SecD
MKERVRTTAFVAAFMFVATAFSAMAAPRAGADDLQEVDRIRAVIAANAEKALQKQGGSRLLFKVDADALHAAVVTELRDDVLKILREGRIPFSGFAMRDGAVEARIAQAPDRQRLQSKLMPPTEGTPWSAGTIGVTDSGDGLLKLAPTEVGLAQRLRGLVGQSMEMIEQRLRSSGIAQAGVQPDGAGRIRVLLPGVSDPERVTAMFSKKARITFRLVDETMSAAEALKGQPPASSEVLYDFKTKAPYLVLKDVAMDGDDVADVAPGFAPQSHDPIASFRFNARGARHFAQITTDNISKPFAIVLDDQVISMSVIREPITGGTAQISGNFTLEDANTIVMLLRSGLLPGRLTVVDRQVVEPAGNAAK